jgi:predicted dehydrogenase
MAIGVGIVGAGRIAAAYAQDIARYPALDLVGVTDLDPLRAQALAAGAGTRAHPTLDQLLGDGDLDLVLNTTVFAAHADVTRRCLLAGRHVYSEKPLALAFREARDLVALARERGLRLGCAPCNPLGEAQQTMWRLLRDGRIGTVRTAYAEAHGGRIEAWHPAPAPFFAVGPMADLAVYPLTLLTAVLGPVRAVHATGRVLRAERTGLDGSPFPVTAPDFVVTALTLATGALVRLTTSFDLPRRGRNTASVEFHGDDGSLHLTDWQLFDAGIDIAPPDGPFVPVPLLRRPLHQVENGRGVLDMAEALSEGRPHRTDAEQAAHLVEVLSAATRSLRTGTTIAVGSGFPPPEPLPWSAR